MSLSCYYGISSIVEMTDLGLIEYDALLKFSAVTDDNVISKKYVSSKVGSFSQFTIVANDCWSFYHCSVLDDCSLANDHIAIDIDRSDQLSFVSLGFRYGVNNFCKVLRKTAEGFPRIFNILE